MGAFVYENNIYHPYVHYHFENYRDDGMFDGRALFTNALSNVKNNNIANYIQLHYNRKQLKVLDQIIQSGDRIETWETELASAITDELSGKLENVTNSYLNMSDSGIQRLGAKQVASSDLHNFLSDLNILMNELGSTPDILKSFAAYLYSNNANSYDLPALRQMTQNFLQTNNIMSIKNPDIAQQFLIKFDQLINKTTAKGNTIKQIGQDRIKNFIKDTLVKDLEYLAPVALEKGLEKANSVIMEEVQIGKTRITATDRRKSATGTSNTVAVKPDSITTLNVNANGVQGTCQFNVGISTKAYKDSTIKKYGVSIHTTNFYKTALSVMKNSPNQQLFDHYLANTIAHQAHEDETGYNALRSAIIKQYIVPFLTGTGMNIIGGGGLKDKAQILFINNKAYSMYQILTRAMNMENFNQLDDMFTLTYKQRNMWIRGAKNGTDNPELALKRSNDFLGKINKILVSLKFHPEVFFKALGL